MAKIVEAYRWGVEEPPEWLVWVGNGAGHDPYRRSETGIGGWQKVTALGEQVFGGELVTIVEKGVWHQAMRHGPATLPKELALIRGGNQ